jgi:alcohol dehydrogenase YqhD (iron-dependent ADH family)
MWDMVFSSHDNRKKAIPPNQALPLLMLPTLPATGSEMNPTAVVTNDYTTEKSYTWDSCLYPKVSIVDPALTCSLSPYQTACGAADTLSHVLEFYLTGFEEAFLNNRIQEAVMLTVLEYAPKVLKDPNDVKSRAHLQWAAIVALNGTTQPGDGWTPMHQLGHVLSAHYDIAHGASLTIIMPAWMRHFYKTRLTQYSTLAKRVFDVDSQGKSDEAVALEGIACFETFLAQIGMPIRLDDVKVDGKEISALTDDVVKISFGSDGKLRSRPPATREDVEAVFTLALKR